MPENRYYLLAGQPAFSPTTGKYKGQRFEPGQEYNEIPKGYEVRFGNRRTSKSTPEDLPQTQDVGKPPAKKVGRISTQKKRDK